LAYSVRRRFGNASADADNVYGVADTSWTEMGMIWNNKPAPGRLGGNSSGRPFVERGS